jgi:hypothetical protein
MFRRRVVSALFGVLILTVSCAEAPPREDETEPAPAPAPVAEKVEGPYYDLTKEDVTSHADWTSMNITLKGVKIGDKYANVEKNLGKPQKTDLIGADQYRAVFDKSSFAIYTYKMTQEIQKIEIYGSMADRIADPQFKKLLSSGDLKYMRETFGMEEKSEINPDTSGMEYFYDARGFRFVQYDPGTRINALMFSKIKR